MSKINYTQGLVTAAVFESDDELKIIGAVKLPVFKKYYNELHQLVELYSMNSEMQKVIGRINNTTFRTDFYDYDDMKPKSDYSPVLVNGKVYCSFSLYYANLELERLDKKIKQKD
jgi:hypothetical protein